MSNEENNDYRYSHSDDNRNDNRSYRRDGERRYSREADSDSHQRTFRPRYNSDERDGERRPFRPRYNSDERDGERRPSFRPRYNNGEQSDGERRPSFRPRYNNGEQTSRRPSFRPRGEEGERSERQHSFRPRYNQDRRPHSFREGSEGGSRRPSYKRPEAKLWRGQSENVRGPRYKVDYRLFDNEDDVERSGSNPERQGMPDQLRLNRFIAMSGVCSRREADELIKNGHIKVNGEVVTEMGVVVSKDDTIECDGRQLQAEKKVYVLLNKPKDCVTTLDDPEGRRTVLDMVADAADVRLFPVGRLDRNTTGILLMTNDGDLADKLMHPRYEVRKMYHVFLDRNVSQEDLELMLRGIELEDGPVNVDEVSYVDSYDKSQVGVVLHSGRNRIVRRIFEHFGYEVVRLDRVYYGGLTKKNVPRGHWRYLTDEEINRLKAGFVR